MFYFNPVKLLYASIILITQADMSVNTSVMEYWMLSDGPSAEGASARSVADELSSLDVCTAKNQQRLGTVFGNFTRHHGKGHKRRMTTSTTTVPPTTPSAGSGHEDTALPPIEPPLASRPHDDLTSRHIHVARVLEPQTNEVRHRSRHRVREVMQASEQESSSAGVNRVKKMYRQGGSSGNRLNVKESSRGGIFLTENCTTVVAQVGTTAVLHCEVSDITENTVTWIRKKDYSLLSVGLVTYSADNRFFSAHGRHIKDWALHIRFCSPSDAGYYECQVPTHPPTSIFFKLVLVAAYAEIAGSAEKLLHAGSRLRLLCMVRRATEPPSYVFWYFQDRMINYDLNGVTVSNGRTHSELVISVLQPRHQGNYTCVPANARPASVTVHIVHSETPAAMQHGNSNSNSSPAARGHGHGHGYGRPLSRPLALLALSAALALLLL